jgi:hypothetical protein
MQSMEEHQEIPKEEAIVKPVKGRKKRHRSRKPAAGRCGEPKELTQSDCGSGKKLVAACRKVSSCATVAWHRRTTIRRIGTGKLWTAVGIKTTHHAEVAWHKRSSIRKDWTENQAEQETPK